MFVTARIDQLRIDSHPIPSALNASFNHIRYAELAADFAQFSSQMTGRLLIHRGAPAIERFVGELANMAPKCWLRPLYPALHPPGTELVRTLEGHSLGVSGVALTPNGKRAVSAAWDKTLKVWDLESGRALRTLEGHSGGIVGVAVTPEGTRAVSAAWDNTLKVWDLESGVALATFTCDAGVTCCAWVSGPRIVAGDAGGRVHLLELEERLNDTQRA